MESNKATVGSLQAMILQLSEERKRADEELSKARAASLDSTIALGMIISLPTCCSVASCDT